MKSFCLVALVSVLLTSFLHADVPPLSAADAAALAQKDLVSRGLESSVFISQLTYKKESLLSGTTYWEILWSSEIPAQTEGREEIGLRIAMDGTYKRSVR